MARVFITGSADGLGLAVGQRLIDQGHEVVLHARSQDRAADTRTAAPGAADVLVGELSSDREVRALARAANDSGRFDAVIHNAGVGGSSGGRRPTADGHATLLAVNVLAPYLLTALMTRPDRLVYLSSGTHHSGSTDLSDIDWEQRDWNGSRAYADSKLLDAALALAVAGRWPEVRSNAVDPGWIATRMGGSSAPGDLEQGSATQVWLAVGDDADVTGKYFLNSREAPSEDAVRDEAFQADLLALLARMTGTELPA